MVIENADHFGLSQLHQLRGRIGRNHLPGYCVLLYSSSVSARAQRRLQVIKENHGGFVIAQEDLIYVVPANFSEPAKPAICVFALPTSPGTVPAHPEVCARLVARWLGDAQEYAGV